MHTTVARNGLNCLSVSAVGPRGDLAKPAAAAARGILKLAVISTLLAIAVRPAQSQTQSVLYNFTGGGDGSNPLSALAASGGNLYGTTGFGGQNETGTVFELSPNGGGGWNENVLYSFCAQTDCSDGGYPSGPVVFDTLGNVYGVTPGGGNVNCFYGTGCGVAYELSSTQTGWTETVLYTFCPQGPVDCLSTGGGDFPVGGLIYGLAGDLYGLDIGGVFRLSSSGGVWTEQVISSYLPYSPPTGLTADTAGNLYAIVNNGFGIVAIELSPNGTGGWNTTTLYKFPRSVAIWGNLVVDQHGNLYGTQSGPANPAHPPGGSLYELSPGTTGWTKKTLFYFPADDSATRGSAPSGGLLLDAAGNIYGTTIQGGAYGDGTVYELVAPTGTSKSYVEKLLWSFNGTDGSQPNGSLILDSSGNLYGTTEYGGSGGAGVVFEVTPPAATTTTLTSSPNPSTDGQAVTFTAVVTSRVGAPPDGETISFKKGTTVLGTGTLSGGSATFTISTLPIDNYRFTAVYGGDLNFDGSTSNVVEQKVVR